MNNISENKEEIYLTSTNIKDNKENDSSVLDDNNSSKYYLNKKQILLLPPIKTKLIKRKKNKSSIIGNISDEKQELPNINSYFVPENFIEYSESCNKFERKLDKLIKEKLTLKNILMKKRCYNEYEKLIMSDLKKKEMIQRSLGNGMFFRIQKYHRMNKKKPFKLIYINNSYNNNERYIKQYKSNDNIISKKKVIKDNSSNKNKVNEKEYIPFYFREKDFNPDLRENFEKRSFTENLNSFRPNSFILKRNKDTNKKSNIINKIRDQKIIMALMKSGDQNLKFNIGSD